ncbi:hypothetical protein GGR54DRAFT_468821 [Hypoxylon sp. NC1633]|nr:hypothetical protein GGR54DRAFT_468821 [Hypoxylon sp. NC1633]
MLNQTVTEPNVDFAGHHPDGNGTPVCCDCGDPVHELDSPTLENLGGFQRRFKYLSGGSMFSRSTLVSSTQSSAPEVHPPAEGLELNHRAHQPGLEFLSGPHIVKSPDTAKSPDGFAKDEHRGWDTEKHGNTETDRNTETDQNTDQNTASRPPIAFGLRRKTLWIIFACILAVIIVGTAVGVAVGVTQNNKSTKALPATATSSTAGSESQVSSKNLPFPSVRTETVVVEGSSTQTSMTTVTPVAALSSSTLSADEPTKSADQVTVTLKQTEASIITTTLKPSTSHTTTSTVNSTPTTPTTNPATKSTTTPQPTTTPKPTTTPTPTSPTQPSTTTTSKKTTATPTSSSSKVCIADDGSTYTDPGTGDKFKIECAKAHQGKDIDNPEAETMQACISLCAKNSECVGAIWYNVGPQGTDLNYCWLKRSMDDSDIRNTPDAQSVVRL